MTNEEKQEIISAVLEALATNSKTISNLTPVTELMDSDLFEVAGGKRVTFANIVASLLSSSGYAAATAAEQADMWQVLMQNFVATQENESVGGVQPQLAHWAQSRVVLLKSMGAPFDDVEASTLSVGDLIYSSQGKWILEKLENNLGNGIHPSDGVLYVNLATFKAYRWDGTSFQDAIKGGSGASSVTAFAQYSVVESTSELPSVGDPTTGYIVGTHIYAYVGENGDTADGKYQDMGEVVSAIPTIDPATGKWVIGGEVTSYPSRGEKGDNAPVPYVGQNGNWWVGGVDTEVPAQGEKGDTVVVTDGQTFEFANNLNDDSTTKGLTAAMGKRLGNAVFDNAVFDMDVDHAQSQGAYINTDNNKWTTSSSYYGKLIDVSSYHGWRFKLGNYLSPTSGNYYYRFALLKSRPTAGQAVVYSDTSPYNAIITRQGAGTPQWEEGVIPNDVNYIYLYTHSSVDMTPQLLVIDPNPSSRINRLEELTDGVDDIKEGWFTVSGENYDFQVPANDCWVKQTVDDNGTTYNGSNATTMRAFPKSSSQSNAAASPSDCYKVDDLPDRTLTVKMVSLVTGYWAFRLVYYTSALGFISRTSAILVKDTDNWQKVINDIPSNAAYFKILMSKNVNGTLDADTYTLNDGDITFVKRSISQESMPDRVAALESAVANAAKDTIRVLSYNIGHFAMGNSSSSTISDLIPDGDTTYPHSNYDVQLARWKSRIQNVCADVMLFCEYSTVFGTKNGAQVTTAACGILDGYPHIAYGTTTTSAYFVNALISKFPLIGSAVKVDLGSLISVKAFMEVGTIVINGVYVKIASCHLTPNSEGNENTRLSRLAEINNIIKYFANDDHVIIGGDFNTTGPMITPRDWALGAEEFNPFLYGFDEEGTHYEGGYTLANHGNWGNLPTYTSTGEKSPGVPTSFIDNILTKGFRMGNVVVIDDGNLTDHCGIMVDLTLA